MRGKMCKLLLNDSNLINYTMKEIVDMLEGYDARLTVLEEKQDG